MYLGVTKTKGNDMHHFTKINPFQTLTLRSGLTLATLAALLQNYFIQTNNFWSPSKLSPELCAIL